ncbi:MAG: DUF3783 domain-containing protein [Candidatus Micrarchaeota archaeon]|nr:DUF3783 domain-containing protein [Candidatus Micrarchaeota archaeon]
MPDATPADSPDAGAPDAENTFSKLESDASGHENDKIVLVSGFSGEELHALIDAYRQNRQLPKAIFATVTDASKDFKVRDLLAELVRERDGIAAARPEKPGMAPPRK